MCLLCGQTFKLKIIAAALHKQINLTEVMIMNPKSAEKMKFKLRVQKEPDYISATLESTK